MRGLRHLSLVLFLTVMVSALPGCGGGDGGSSGSSTSTPDYGGSVPKGDYVTADIDTAAQTVTLKNWTTDTETTLSYGPLGAGFESLPDIIQATEADNDGFKYFMVYLPDIVLAMQKVQNDGTPVDGELPIYMFDKAALTADDLKDRAFNFMEFYVDDETGNAAIELGIVGFDSDTSGRLYGAAYDSQLAADPDPLYSITDEDGIPDSGDELSLALSQAVSDGSLVIWENGVGNWQAATTITGTATGPAILDHGPDAGGGAGFALPQVAETDPDAFWAVAAGDYFLVVYNGDGSGVAYYKCSVSQDVPGGWEANVNINDIGDNSALPGAPFTVERIADGALGIPALLEAKAQFDSAQSTTVQNAEQGGGVFQEQVAEPDFFITFDPNGKYIGIVDGPDPALFGVGARVEDWPAAP